MASVKGYLLSKDAISAIRRDRADLRALLASGRMKDGLPPLLPSAAKGSASIALPVPAMITGGSNGIYSVDLYADGYSAASTGSAMLIALELSYGETVPTGTQVIACPWQITATGAGES